ncbi:MAG: NifU family protein [Deltaproteobacteria bacterium]|nr:NifU family protein [Deltaproteobacteria bacterium]
MTDRPSIQTLSTPNPAALMFRVSEVLVPSGTYTYERAEEASDSSLARRLFAIEGTEQVMVARDFVTVTRQDGEAWEPVVVEAVEQAIGAFLASGDLAVERAVAPPALTDSGLEGRVRDLIDRAIAPALANDGGSIEFVGIDDGFVRVRLSGACGTCPHATATLTYGVQRYLMENVPEVKGVVRVG